MKAVVGIDGSENSFDAIVQACRMLDPERDCLALYSAMPHVQVGIPAAHDVAERGRAKLSQSILARAALHVPEAWKGRFQRIVGADDPSRGILNTAEELAADLIVVGTHGLGGLGRLLVGSVSRKVIHGSTVPVMVARKRSHAKEQTGLHVLLACESLATGRQLSVVLSRFAWPSGTVAEVVHVAQAFLAGRYPIGSTPKLAAPTLKRPSSSGCGIMIIAWQPPGRRCKLSAANSQPDSRLRRLPSSKVRPTWKYSRLLNNKTAISW